MKTSRDQVVGDIPYLIRAAEIIEEVADALFASETCDGKWSDDAHGNKAMADYDEWMEVADRLRRMVLVAGRST